MRLGEHSEFNLARSIGNGVIRRAHRDDHRTHFRVNVAEDVRNPRPVKIHGVIGSCLKIPRSNRLPSKRENTLWKKGSKLGNSTVEPTDTTSK